MQSVVEVIGGSSWINLVNTVCYQRGIVTDLLKNDNYLTHWMMANELVQEEELKTLAHLEQDQLFLDKLKQLRDIFSAILRKLVSDQPMTEEDAQNLVNFTNTIHCEYVYVTQEKEQRPTFQWKGRALADNVLLQLVFSFTSTLHNVELDRIRKCEHDECLLHFVDTSKAGKRRWCSMDTCGNRKKVASFYTRRKKKLVATSSDE